MTKVFFSSLLREGAVFITSVQDSLLNRNYRERLVLSDGLRGGIGLLTVTLFALQPTLTG